MRTHHMMELKTAITCSLLIAASMAICGVMPTQRNDTAVCAETETAEPLPTVTPAPVPSPVPQTKTKSEPQTPSFTYTDEDVMCLANMVFGEISAVAYDDSYTFDEQNLIMQQWARVAVNHIGYGIEDSIPTLMRSVTASGYYVWHPIYGTVSYMEQAVGKNAELYERCRVNVLIALTDCMTEEVPCNVIYASLARQGSGTYKEYSIDTGYYASTVYLCYA